VIKQRIAQAGQGRSGEYRMLIAYRSGEREEFLYGFAKSVRANITAEELLTVREIGAAWLAADSRRLARALKNEASMELTHDQHEAQPSHRRLAGDGGGYAELRRAERQGA